MKRMMSFLLALCLLLSMAGCGEKEEPAPDPEKPVATAAPNNETVPPTEAPAPQEQETPVEAPELSFDRTELVNDENLIFAVTEFITSDHTGLQMEIYCENKTGRDLTFAMECVSVCGMMYDPSWVEEVAAGSTVNSTAVFDTYDLEKMGVTSVDEISFRLSVVDSENWMDEPLVEDMYAVYPTGLTAQTVVYPEYRHKNGETVLVDNEDILFIIEKVDDAGNDLYTLHCYIENRMDRDMLLSWDDVAVNSREVYPLWACVVGAGKQRYTTVGFFRSDLEEQGIDDVREIVFTLTAFDYTSFDGNCLVNEELTFRPK